MPRPLQAARRVLGCIRATWAVSDPPCRSTALPYRGLCVERPGQVSGGYSTLPLSWEGAGEEVQEGSFSEEERWHGKEPLTVSQVDWDALSHPAELIGGHLWSRSYSTRPRHTRLQAELYYLLRSSCPGWVLYPSVSVRYSQVDQFDHDLAGWHNTVPFADDELELCTSRPDLVCEMVSSIYKGSGNKQIEERDTVHKMARLAHQGVPRYWLFFSVRRKVERYELQCNPTGDPQQNIYKLMDSVNPATGKVRWAPFEQVDLDLDALFGRMRS